MFEVATSPAMRRAIKIAHEERAETVAQAWGWLFGKKSSR
ncbi:hypothetical protein ASD8599_00824 [Ascidiaceihabitans donghaensis]|uniref:Uncharacterized protein n=1 Tax=Ascidiaceihabitans donghaensis TaxID=1510460 RepID=A0A2R8BAH8_9RHOB|nr:hypothetical protein ASD8599_00824 [Ascidiaceihabitans donghaensis]